MRVKVRITFNHEPHLHTIEGLEVPLESLTLGDLTESLTRTQEHLSRVMGMPVLIETDIV